MDKLWKIWKETAFIVLCSFFIDILAFKQGKLCLGVGIIVSFSGRSFALKSCPGAGILMEKISGPRGRDGNQSNWYLHNLASEKSLSSF